MTQLTYLAIAASLLSLAGCDKKQADAGAARVADPVADPVPVAPAPAPAPPFATFDEAAAATGAYLDEVVAAMSAASSNCARLSSNLAALEGKAATVAARLGATTDAAATKKAGEVMLGKISCIMPMVTDCLSSSGVGRFFQSSGWVGVRHAVIEWAGEGTTAPPCATPRTVPHPAAINDADAAEQEEIAVGFEKLAEEMRAADGDCKAATKAILAYAAKTPMNAHEKRMAVMMSDNTEVMDWYMKAYHQRFSQAIVATLKTNDACKTDKKYAAAAGKHPLVGFFLGF